MNELRVNEKERQIVLDTETTGFDPKQGHRIIEIGCVEIIDRHITGEHYHVYLNPEREVDEGAFKVHGLSDAFLADKPKFADVAAAFIAFIQGAELIIHNAPFDVGFIDHELALLAEGGGPAFGSTDALCQVLDTLMLARRKYPGQRNSLDALCRRLEVDNSDRTLHGALLDAQILAEVYLAMTGGQLDMTFFDADGRNSADSDAGSGSDWQRPESLVIQRASPLELNAHHERLQQIKDKAGHCLWLGE